MPIGAKDRLIVALDCDSMSQAVAYVEDLEGFPEAGSEKGCHPSRRDSAGRRLPCRRSVITADPHPCKAAERVIAEVQEAFASLKSGLAELIVFYCERAAGFSSDLGIDDENYLSALVRMFEQALAVANALPADSREALLARLDRVRNISQKIGYGVGDDMDSILAKYM